MMEWGTAIRRSVFVTQRVWLSLVLLGCCAPPVARATDVDVWLTRGDQLSLLEQRPALTFTPGTGTHGTKIHVDPTVRYQPMDGFGAALTDSSAWLIDSALDDTAAATLLEELFSTTNGLGLSVVRVPMGASDFALVPYTYNDMPPGQTDESLEHFSIAHDLQYIVPTLHAAQALNPDLKLIATPWSPPAWMKTSQTLFGGGLQTAYYAAYAQYFVKFVQAYEAHGLPVYAVTPQNEPLHDSAGLPSMAMPTYVQSAFVGDHLGPAFAGAGVSTKILVYDHNWDEWNYPIIVMNDPEAG
jgi:glucosylceramidase